MRLAEHANKLETNTEFESQNFGVGDASVVIEILRKHMYQHPRRTLVQEYMCNARDAHREAGNPAPIQVTIPNRMSPTFKVRDFGPGITPERMRDVFVMYGASTKRENNKQTGGFGIGAKSAWSYTDSFTIVTHVDGTRRTYVAHTGVNNNGRLDLITTELTDEPNGTEIQIAVRTVDLEEFKYSIFRACYFWDVKPVFKGLVDLDGFGTHKGFKLGSHFEAIEGLPAYLSSSGYGHTVVIAIDGVAYLPDSELIERVKSLRELKSLVRMNLALSIGNGLLEVSASREQLADTPKTRENLEKLADKVLKEVKAHIKAEFDKVTDVCTFLQTYTRMNHTFDVGGHALYKGYKIENGVISGPHFATVLMEHTRNGSRSHSNYMVKRTPKTALSTRDYGNVYYVSTLESHVVLNRRLRTLIMQKPGGIILLSKLPKSVPPAGSTEKAFAQLVQDLNAIDLSTIAQTKAEPKARVARQVTEICAHIPIGQGRETRTVVLGSDETKYIYATMDEGAFKRDPRQMQFLRNYLERTSGVKLIGVAELTAKKIKDRPEFQSLEDFLSNFVPSAKDLASAKRTLAGSMDAMQVIAKADGVKCKFFSSMQKEYQSLISISDHCPQILLDVLKKTDEIKTFIERDKKLTESVNSKYRLLKMIDQYTRMKGEAAEWVEYINAKS